MEDEAEAAKEVKVGPFTIFCHALFTGIDGKFKMHMTGTKGTGKCSTCGATTKQRAKRNGKFKPKPGTIKYGSCVMHLRPRVMEYCFKFYINKDVESWMVRREFRRLAEWRKRDLIQKVWDQLKIDIYKVFPGKQGNSNRGNTSRELFKHSETFARILEVDDHLLIEDLGVMLIAANCVSPIGNSFDLFYMQAKGESVS